MSDEKLDEAGEPVGVEEANPPSEGDGEEKAIEKVDDVDGEKIDTEPTKAHVLDVAPGCLAVDLPSGYIFDGEPQVTAIVKEMTGYEEDILAGKGSIVTKLNAIVGNCLVQLGTISEKSTLRSAASKLTGQDRMAILLAIRRVSLGDLYDSTATCPECNVGQHFTLDLKEVEIVAMPDRMDRVREDVLPSKTEVTWHVINSDDEEWLTQKRKKKEDQLTLGLLARVDTVGDVEIERGKAYKKALALLKGLSTRDRNWLRERFEKTEGKIDTEADFECEECGHSWKAKMDISQASFFFPSAS